MTNTQQEKMNTEAVTKMQATISPRITSNTNMIETKATTSTEEMTITPGIEGKVTNTAMAGTKSIAMRTQSGETSQASNTTKGEKKGNAEMITLTEISRKSDSALRTNPIRALKKAGTRSIKDKFGNSM